MFIKFLLYISWAGATFSYIFVKSVIPHSYMLKYNICLYNNFRYIVNFLTCRSFTLSFKFLASFIAGLDCFFRVPVVRLLLCWINAVDPRAYNTLASALTYIETHNHSMILVPTKILLILFFSSCNHELVFILLLWTLLGCQLHLRTMYVSVKII